MKPMLFNPIGTADWGTPGGQHQKHLAITF